MLTDVLSLVSPHLMIAYTVVSPLSAAPWGIGCPKRGFDKSEGENIFSLKGLWNAREPQIIVFLNTKVLMA